MWYQSLGALDLGSQVEFHRATATPRGGRTGGRTDRVGGRTRGRSDDQGNGRTDDQGGQGNEVNDGVDGVPDFSNIIAQ
ncbi:hypothetical protein Tco_1226017 [Tanacetum coccineum]